MSIDISDVDGIVRIALNRPEALNAIDPSMRSALQNLWLSLAKNDSARVAIITGTGNKAFSSGADLKSHRSTETSFATQTFLNNHNDSLITGIEHVPIPIICAFNGLAYGAGLELGLACDIRIASENARFALPEVKVGSMPGSGGTQLLSRVVGEANALYLILSGASIDAATALRIGLISEVVTLEKLPDRAQQLAEMIRDNAPLAVRAAKFAVKKGFDLALDKALLLERQIWGHLRDSVDRAEGRAAFMEKRKPKWQGK